MNNTNDGGPAFPRNYDADGHNGMTLRDYFAAHAPASEIEEIVPQTVKEISDWLGVETYDYRVHWQMALAKARHLWADAMLSARGDV